MLQAVPEKILTVSQVTGSIRELLESHYRFIHVCGEISNLKTPFSGHSYFTLKDAGAQLRVVVFKQQKRFLTGDLADGQQVVVFGRISVYEPRGEYQLIADSVEAYGIGNLLREFELLKKRLGDRGFFATERKKPLPPFPQKVVVITSPTGAAIQDFLKIVSRRNYPLHLLILPVKVQGKDSAAEIAVAIGRAQALAAEVIVLCRGGGSIEDLWSFNEEKVAEAIYRSAIPVVTGIGHETDTTIADFCADCRCPTPTAAAELLVPDGIALRRHINGLEERLQLALDHKLDHLEQRLRLQRNRLGVVERLCSRLDLRLQLDEERLRQAIQDDLLKRERRLGLAVSELRRRLSVETIDLRSRRVGLLAERIHHQMTNLLSAKEARLAKQLSLLQGLSPLATLARGYAVLRSPAREKDGYSLITSTEDVAVGERVEAWLKDGRLLCQVVDKVDGSIVAEMRPGSEARPGAGGAEIYSSSSPEKK